MQSLLKLLALTAQVSGPRRTQPTNILRDLSNGADVFHSLGALHSYRAGLTEEFVHNIIRYDPGVHSVIQGSFINDEEDFDPVSEHEHVEQPSEYREGEGLSRAFKRAVRWMKINRKGWYHLQEITAGNRMENKRREMLSVPMLRKAGEGVVMVGVKE